jgi:outer membrane protein OmpA-like peptidoglycan-associated protein
MRWAIFVFGFGLWTLGGPIGAWAPVTGAHAQTVDEFIEALQPSEAGKERAVPRKGEREETPRPTGGLIAKELTFEFDSAELTLSGQQTVDRLAEAMKSPQLSDAVVRIVGHTDAAGSKEYNQKLSEARAKAVYERLTQTHKISASRVRAEGRGESELADPESPEAAVNRRVVITRIEQGA